MELKIAPAHGTLSKFYMDVFLRAKDSKWRLGQAAFNLLQERRPDLAELVRATDCDPFYLDGPASNIQKWEQFALTIEQQWYIK
jgi:hypothetical protein